MTVAVVTGCPNIDGFTEDISVRELARPGLTVGVGAARAAEGASLLHLATTVWAPTPSGC